MTDELKPCPFCGEAQQYYGPNNTVTAGRQEYRFKCDCCCAEGPVVFEDRKDEAAAEWNRRVDQLRRETTVCKRDRMMLRIMAVTLLVNVVGMYSNGSHPGNVISVLAISVWLIVMGGRP